MVGYDFLVHRSSHVFQYFMNIGSLGSRLSSVLYTFLFFNINRQSLQYHRILLPISLNPLESTLSHQLWNGLQRMT